MTLLLLLYRNQATYQDSTLSQFADAAKMHATNAAVHAANKMRKHGASLSPKTLDSVGRVGHHSTYATAFVFFAMILTGIIGSMGRVKLRKLYGIRGNVLGDFLCHCCCHSCSLAREAREIRSQKIMSVLSTTELQEQDEIRESS